MDLMARQAQFTTLEQAAFDSGLPARLARSAALAVLFFILERCYRFVLCTETDPQCAKIFANVDEEAGASEKLPEQERCPSHWLPRLLGRPDEISSLHAKRQNLSAQAVLCC
eukprot:TRINITY_DN106104_c0_g1_i1.p1 TRINITY_DN106104_c0_g1~~TRINITY_DN106104_c0_g1_i1.p1  ORF type:complete len:131 (+),score=19.40 TRINITY_DN106104_c0_g1_i1:59-394(+)